MRLTALRGVQFISRADEAAVARRRLEGAQAVQ